MTVEKYFTEICPDVHIRNALFGSGVRTMTEVCDMTVEQLLRTRNFSLKTLAVVLEERERYRAGNRSPALERR